MQIENAISCPQPLSEEEKVRKEQETAALEGLQKKLFRKLSNSVCLICGEPLTINRFCCEEFGSSDWCLFGYQCKKCHFLCQIVFDPPSTTWKKR